MISETRSHYSFIKRHMFYRILRYISYNRYTFISRDTFIVIGLLIFYLYKDLSITKALWSNEIGKRCLSKVVQKVRNHSNLSFYNYWIGTYRVISISYDGIILQTFFFTFFCRHNEGTLVK